MATENKAAPARTQGAGIRGIETRSIDWVPDSERHGKVWHQAQVAHLQKPPRLGDLFGQTPVDGQVKKVEVEGNGEKFANPPGEWNTFDIACKGPKVTVTVNGKLATTWDGCQVPRGHVGLQAEFFFIEFKNLKFRPDGADRK